MGKQDSPQKPLSIHDAIREEMKGKPKMPQMNIQVTAHHEPIPEPLCKKLEWLLAEVVTKLWSDPQGAQENLKKNYYSVEDFGDEVRAIAYLIRDSRAFRDDIRSKMYAQEDQWEAYLRLEADFKNRMDRFRRNPDKAFREWQQEQKENRPDWTS